MATPAVRPTPVIRTLELCERAVADPGLASRIGLEQKMEIVGGISNLYCYEALSRGADTIDLETTDAFASRVVSRSDILIEIGSCSSIPEPEAQERILQALQTGLRDCFINRELTGAVLPCLGRFTPIELEQDRYRLEFRLPLAAHFESH